MHNLEFVKLKASEILINEKNPRKIKQQNRETLKVSIEKFGLVEPLIVDEDSIIIGGHQRFDVAKEMGIEEFDCVKITGLSEAEKIKLNVTLNNPKLQGRYDIDKLKILLDEIRIDEDFESLRFGALEPIAVKPVEKVEVKKDEDGNAIVQSSKIEQLMVTESQHMEIMDKIEVLSREFDGKSTGDTIIKIVDYVSKNKK